jgi:MFS family permease
MNQAPTSTEGNNKSIYCWVMAIMAMLLLMVTNGLTTTGITAFDSAILKEFGWSRGDFKFRDLLTLVVAGVAAPLAGVLIDKLGVRRLMVVGLVMFSALYFLYGRIGSLTHLYAIHVGFGIVLVCAGVNIAVILASQWFVQHRGTAVGIAVMGSSLGGIVYPSVIVNLIQQHGWRDGFAYMTIVPAVFLVLVLLLVRTPQEKGLQPYGFGDPAARAAAPSPNDLRYADALKTRSFWALAVVAMTTFYSVLAVVAHLFLHMRDLGFPPQDAAKALAALFLPGLFSKFIFGFLADRFNPRVVFVGNLIIMLIGLVLLATFDKGIVWTAISIIGFGWGGAYTLIQLQAVNNFGLTDAGKILGTITFMDAIAGGVGIWLTGVLFDQTKSYHTAFYILVGLVALAVVASSQVKREIKSA